MYWYQRNNAEHEVWHLCGPMTMTLSRLAHYPAWSCKLGWLLIIPTSPGWWDTRMKVDRERSLWNVTTQPMWLHHNQLDCSSLMFTAMNVGCQLLGNRQERASWWTWPVITVSDTATQNKAVLLRGFRAHVHTWKATPLQVLSSPEVGLKKMLCQNIEALWIQDPLKSYIPPHQDVFLVAVLCTE